VGSVLPEDLALVEQLSTAYVERAYDVALELLDPEVIFHGTVGGLDEGRVVRGRSAVIDGFVDYAAMWERLSLVSEGIFDAGERALVFYRERGRSRHSETEVETKTAALITVSGGKVVEVRPYLDRGDAIAAAGLDADAVGRF
jgi:ketosteroid isomerase-like protein